MGKLDRLPRETARRATVLGIPLVLWATAALAGAPDGKQVFLNQKCNTCHAVSSAGIEAMIKMEKMRGPDLTGVVTDKAKVKDYVLQKSDMNGKKHPKKAGGSDDEVNALVDWLAAQKK